jgi:ATP-dependent DNA helicase RecG
MVEESAPVSAVVGGKTAAVLEKVFGIATAGDLLRHYPRRYYERGELADLSTLRAGDQVTLQVQVAKITGRQIRPKLSKTDLTVTDASGGSLLVTFFNRRYLERQLVVGDTVVLAGEVEWFGKRLQLKQPEVNLDSDVEDVAGTLMPVYPATKGLQSWQIRKAIRTALPMVDVPDVVPEPLRKQRGLVGIDEALRGIHMPEDRP